MDVLVLDNQFDPQSREHLQMKLPFRVLAKAARLAQVLRQMRRALQLDELLQAQYQVVSRRHLSNPAPIQEVFGHQVALSHPRLAQP